MLRENFNQNWLFYKEGYETESIQVNLPHDAMFYEKRASNCKNGWNTGYFPGGVYVYKKILFCQEEYRKKNITLEFEGVYMNSDVYINDTHAGGCHYGYSNFYIHANPFLKYGQENEIKVVAHNENEPNSRWYSGSGIYRNVNIIVGELLHIPCDGVKITTITLDETAFIEVKMDINNNSKENCRFEIRTEILSKDTIITSNLSKGTAKSNTKTEITQNIIIKNPKLWSIDYPNLYTCKTQIMENNQIIDENIENFGIRIIEVDAKSGFRINKIETKLRGACIHHDNGIIGAMTFKDAEARRVRILKDAGYNAIRSAHNPISKAMLDACDKYGMLVMDETFDMWFGHKNPYDYATWFEECWKEDVEAMVLKDFNHPSVVMYSIGNEIGETAKPKGIAYNQEIVEFIRTLDRSRPIINSINLQMNMANYIGFGVYDAEPKTQKPELKEKKPAANTTGSAWINNIMNFIDKISDWLARLKLVDKATKEAFAALDIAGYNYAEGRYLLDGRLYPLRVICGTETYPPDIAKNWRLVKKLPYLIGDFQWTGWDYLGEAGIGMWFYGKSMGLLKPYPGLISGCGTVDLTGYITSQAVYNQIVWGLRKTPYIGVRPMSHANKHVSKTVWRGTDAIESWTWDGYEGKDTTIEVYSNADWVELLLNGTLIGRKRVGDPKNYKAIFKTKYQPGELIAVAYDSDKNEVGRSVLKTASARLQLTVNPEINVLNANGQDLAYINIAFTDENGIVKPLINREISLKLEGEGVLLGFGSANPFTEEVFTETEHTTYFGRALAIVRSEFKVGNVKISISAEGCETRTLIIPVKG